MMGSFDIKKQDKAARIFRLFAVPPEWDHLPDNLAPFLSILDFLAADDASIVTALAHPIGQTDWTQVERR